MESPTVPETYGRGFICIGRDSSLPKGFAEKNPGIIEVAGQYRQL